MGKVEMGINREELADVVEFLRKVEVENRPLADMGQNVMLYMVMRELRELRGVLMGGVKEEKKEELPVVRRKRGV